jgi:signal transduction histidine kinase/CheY-like chemotaxis protein
MLGTAPLRLRRAAFPNTAAFPGITMHDALRFLSTTRLSRAARYGAALLAIASMTLIRLVAPLDTAPFLLYLPIIFGIALALGPGAAAGGVILSDLLAAFFFLHDGGRTSLTTGQITALVEYLVVGATMVALCDALRRAIIENDATLSALERSRGALLLAKEEADIAKGAAEEANKAKSAFLANMSHELRTPLSAVIGYSEMLEEEVEELGEKSMLADLGKIKSNAKHLLSLINDVLDLSKIEANKMDLYIESLEVAGFAQDVAATVDSLIRRKGNTLALDIASDVGSIQTDTVKVRQCLFNLLSNAAKFTENGRITLTVRRETSGKGAWVSFAVSDTGIGMTPEQLGRLFQRFMQADETTTRQFGGTGLGLALSRAFAHMLGGEITVESTEGRGTCFTLRLPAAPASAALEAPLQPSGTDVSGRDLVLVIDDEADQRDLVTRFLERRGYAVQTAADGRTGLELARTIAPKVILLDVMMPEMDGWSVLSALKHQAETAAIPVVMISFVADPAMSEALGAAEALPKPVDWARLEAVMERFRDDAGVALVVDDDADMRQRLRTVLERSGWVVREAANGAEALKLLVPAPQLILLDLTMPVMDGFTFLHQLRETPGCLHIPVVVLSARDITGSEREQLGGADRILRKGEASMTDLANEVRQLRPGQ